MAIKFGVSQMGNPTPKIWERISTSLRYFLVSLIGLISATDVIPPTKSKLIILGMSVLILLLKSIDMGLGISDEGQAKGGGKGGDTPPPPPTP